jgi:hypothetical protein
MSVVVEAHMAKENKPVTIEKFFKINIYSNSEA